MIWQLPVEDLFPLCAAFNRSNTHMNKMESGAKHPVLKDVQSGLEKAG